MKQASATDLLSLIVGKLEDLNEDTFGDAHNIVDGLVRRLEKKLESRDLKWRELHAEIDTLRAQSAVQAEELGQELEANGRLVYEQDRLRGIIDDLGGAW